MDKTKVIVVAGPTASGKTTLAVEIAKAVEEKLFLPTPCRYIREWK